MWRRCLTEYLQWAVPVTLIGWWLGDPIFALALASLIYSGLLVYRLDRLKNWVENNIPKARDDDPGRWVDPLKLLDDDRKRRRSTKKKQLMLLVGARRSLNGIPEPILVVNDKNEVFWFNKFAADFFKSTLRQSRAKPLSHLVEDQGLSQGLAQLDDAEHRSIALTVDIRGNALFEVHLQRLFNGYKCIYFRDISLADRVLRSQRYTLANLSHEIKTPLTLIQGYVDIIDEKVGKEKDRLQRIREMVRRISEFLNFNIDRMRAMLGEEAANPATATIDVATWVRDYIDNCRSAGQLEHPITVEIADTVKIRGSETELSSIFTNLINNARHHTPAGTPIKIRAFYQYDEFIFEVNDQGSGIEEHHIDHLTEMFYQFNDGRPDAAANPESKTHGMGLPIVDSILRRLHGRLTVQSTVGKGSSFRCAIPIDRPDPLR